MLTSFVIKRRRMYLKAYPSGQSIWTTDRKLAARFPTREAAQALCLDGERVVPLGDY